MTAPLKNTQRMPFAEWLYRMHEADLPYQARALAIYAVAFRISGNEELAMLAGVAERTYDKWKKLLLDDGWVIISRRVGGRGVGIEVSPALREVPVEFTDLKARNPRNYCALDEQDAETKTPAEVTGAKDAGAEITGAINTGAASAETAIIAPLSTSETPATIAATAKETPVISAASAEVAEVLPPLRARPRANTESPSEISYSLDTLPLPPQTSKLEATVGETGGEEELVQVNCVTIKGPNFTIDLKAIDQAAFLAGMPSERARAIAEIYAREWAANNSKPNHPMAYLRKMIAADRNDAAIAEVRLAKATDGLPRNSPQVETTETRVERMKRRAAEKLEQLKGGRA